MNQVQIVVIMEQSYVLWSTCKSHLTLTCDHALWTAMLIGINLIQIYIKVSKWTNCTNTLFEGAQETRGTSRALVVGPRRLPEGRDS